jgi:hypothetical protein
VATLRTAVTQSSCPAPPPLSRMYLLVLIRRRKQPREELALSIDCARSAHRLLRWRDPLSGVHKRNPAFANLFVQVWHCFVNELVQLLDKRFEFRC